MTAPKVGLREAVEALSVPASPDEDLRENGYYRALATHPSPPLPGQPGVAEVVQQVLDAHANCEAGSTVEINADKSGTMHYPCGQQVTPVNGLAAANRAHVAAEVARTLGSEA